MRCQAVVRLQDGARVALGHGDLVGRLWSCALLLDDPRVSEAHALVSVRGHELKLLALRGRFSMDGRPLAELALRPGQRIAFADGLWVDVVEVELPEEVLGLRAPGQPVRVLPGTCALVGGPEPRIVPPADPAAAAHVWAGPDGWRIRTSGEGTRPLEAGTTVRVAGVEWRAEAVRLRPDTSVTTPDAALVGPLRIVARYDTVHIERRGMDTAVVAGLPARVLSELVAFGGPVPWELLCRALWPDGGSRKQLDMALVRLRRKLREHRVRTDLVRADGAGVLELYLQPDDQALDVT